MWYLPGSVGQMVRVIFLFGITLCTAQPTSTNSSGNSDLVSMIQVAMNSNKEMPGVIHRDFTHDPFWRQRRNDPFWMHQNTDPTTQNFDGIPVYQHNRVHTGALSPRNEWIIVYPQTYTHDMLKQTCQVLNYPAMCDHVSHPEKGEMAFTTVHAYESELRASKVYNAFNIKANYIQLDGPMRMNSVMSWGLDRIDQAAPPLDSTYTVPASGGSGVHIYHLDTGVADDIPEFTSGVAKNAERYWDITTDVSCVPPTPLHCAERAKVAEAQPAQCIANCALDKEGHGSHTAGTICGYNYGVAKDATCHSMKVLNDQGTGAWHWFMQAVNEVVSAATKPCVISASLGSPNKEPAIEACIDTAVAASVVVVVAAGNEAGDACQSTPGYISSAIVVGSTDDPDAAADKISYFSNTGTCVDIYAPGSFIPSVNNKGQEMKASGTSMSAPHVAGAVALSLTSSSRQMSSVTVPTSGADLVCCGYEFDASAKLKLLQVQWIDAGVSSCSCH